MVIGATTSNVRNVAESKESLLRVFSRTWREVIEIVLYNLNRNNTADGIPLVYPFVLLNNN